ncbi:Fur family transcriptional regulator [Salipaludibacillus sp. HK11]|uniref:Fur family transcriptional regulator n=1 Tax=Salipaludibacillus sp. HK11 TaxID=3394320 RepID=UPI0039FD6C96
MDWIIERLCEAGYKMTDKRKRILTCFGQESRYKSAKSVYRLMKFFFPTISLDTIYRNLTLYESLGIIESTEWRGETIYCLASHQAKHQHHLICIHCGKIHRIDFCPMSTISVESEGFVITGHKFEVYGYCLECQQNT